MSVLRSLSTSYSASKFLPPADSSQQFFLLHYILLLFFSCLFLLRRPNISLLQIFSLFTYFPVFFTSADQNTFSFELFCFYWENTDCPKPVLNQYQNDKEAKKLHSIFLFFLLCSPFLPSYIFIMPHYTSTLLTTTPLKSHEVFDPIPPFIFANW